MRGGNDRSGLLQVTLVASTSIWIIPDITTADIRDLCRLTCYSNATCRANGYSRVALQERSGQWLGSVVVRQAAQTWLACIMGIQILSGERKLDLLPPLLRETGCYIGPTQVGRVGGASYRTVIVLLSNPRSGGVKKHHESRVAELA